jgi:hypothetical protein
LSSHKGPYRDRWVEIRVKVLYWGIWWPLTSPFRLYRVGKKLKQRWDWEHSEWKLQEKALRKQRRKNKPKPLPGKRKRALSLPASEKPRLKFLGGKRTQKQEAALLIKLPFDIRRMIWSW